METITVTVTFQNFKPTFIICICGEFGFLNQFKENNVLFSLDVTFALLKQRKKILTLMIRNSCLSKPDSRLFHETRMLCIMKYESTFIISTTIILKQLASLKLDTKLMYCL
jgi:hypothetical protein